MIESYYNIPLIPFYFVRHGQTDWNKINQTLCDNDLIQLNQTGIIQANNIKKQFESLKITKIYSSPLMRAKQTAEILNTDLKIHVEFHAGLCEILDEKIADTFNTILKSSNNILVVSHGEVYRVLLRILNAQTNIKNAKNCGLYFFSPPDLDSNNWLVHEIAE